MTTMSDVTAAIQAKLESTGCDFEILCHEPVYTMEDVDRSLSIPTKARVKTLVVSCATTSGNEPILIGLPATARLDLKRVARLIGASRNRLHLMSIEDAQHALAMSQGAIGLVAPYISPQVILNSSFVSQPYLYCGMGRNDRTLKIRTQHLVNVIQVTFAELDTNDS